MNSRLSRVAVVCSYHIHTKTGFYKIRPIIKDQLSLPLQFMSLCTHHLFSYLSVEENGTRLMFYNSGCVRVVWLSILSASSER